MKCDFSRIGALTPLLSRGRPSKMRFALVLGSLAVGISGALALDDLIISSCYSKGSNCVTIKNPKLDHCFKIEDSAKRGDVGSFFGVSLLFNILSKVKLKCNR